MKHYPNPDCPLRKIQLSPVLSLMLLFSIPIPFKKGEWVCDDCEFRWKEEKAEEH